MAKKPSGGKNLAMTGAGVDIKFEPETRVVFDYIKSTQFRTIRADGAIGSITPRGFIHFALYSDRPAIPRKTMHTLNPDGTVGSEIPEERVAREGIVREMEVDVFMTVDAAEALAGWLDDKVKEQKNIMKELEKTKSKPKTKNMSK